MFQVNSILESRGLSPLPCPLAKSQKFDYQEGILRMKKEKLRFAEENEDNSLDVSENRQEMEGSILSEDVSTKKALGATKSSSVTQNSVTLDDSIYDFQPTESKYSVVRRSFGKFSVGVGHKKMKRGKFC